MPMHPCVELSASLMTVFARLVAERATAVVGRPVTPDAELTWPLLVSIVMEIGGVAAHRVRREAEWGRDLGMD